DRLTFGLLQNILISPPDFLSFTLVGICGVLGACLRLVLISYQSGTNPPARNVMIAPLLGLLFALITYVLFRAGFIVVTDKAGDADNAAISPFIVALMAVASGLLSERAIVAFRRSTDSWFGGLGQGDGDRWAINLSKCLKSSRKSNEW